MSIDQFKQAVDSLEGFPEFAAKMTGRQPIGPFVGCTGGDFLLHLNFEEMCAYLRSKFPKEQCGLWTCLPKGKEEYREIIVETFSHVFFNDHGRNDIQHFPFLVSCEEVIPDKGEMWCAINNCQFNRGWSATINPKGAWFCEMAGAQAMLIDGDGGWPIEKGWWKRPPWDFKDQIEKYCPKCGGAAHLPLRSSLDNVDDISPKNLERLRGKSKKIDEGRYVVSDLQQVDPKTQPPMAAYKDLAYRNAIAARYGLFLTINPSGFWTPHLKKSANSFFTPKDVMDIYKERWV